jgi:uncharacterized membrane protein YhaH (DUF805 family)
MHWYFEVFRKYFDFDGRARRKEYWMFFLINLIVSIILGIIIGVITVIAKRKGADVAYIRHIYPLVTLIPSVAVGIRRMHDSNHKGWWILCPLYNIYLLVVRGTQGENRFGADPVGLLEEKA